MGISVETLGKPSKYKKCEIFHTFLQAVGEGVKTQSVKNTTLFFSIVKASLISTLLFSKQDLIPIPPVCLCPT